jgi:hypothetical protein
MADEPLQGEKRIRAEIEALHRALDARRRSGRKLPSSVVTAYRAALDRHYARLERALPTPMDATERA